MNWSIGSLFSGIGGLELGLERAGLGPTKSQVPVPSNGGWGRHWESVEPGLVPLVHGVSSRLVGRTRREQIRLLGNAVVPQCSEVIGWIIRELAGDVP